MIPHESKAEKVRHPFFDLAVVDNGDGTISIPAGKFYIQGQGYDLAAVENEPFPDGARLFVEKAQGRADYFLDTTGHAVPVSFGPNLEAILVVWNEGGEIHCLRSVEL